MGQSGWFGEGDDFFYIDGEPVPSLQGTGSEDYFNDAWGFRVRTGPWFGQPRWQGELPGDSGVCYRWHLPDPVYFSKSLKVEIEHRGNLDESEDGFFLERPDFFSSVAYWYQTGEPKTTFPPLPGWHERRVPWEQVHLVKAFRYARTTGQAKVQVQTQGFFGARPVLLWPNDEAGVMLTLPFKLSQDGRFAVRLTAASGPRNGLYDIDPGRQEGPHRRFPCPRGRRDGPRARDSRVEQGQPPDLLSAPARTRAGRAAGRGGPAVLEVAARGRATEKTHHEAHFIRLGIGRALYAYRLAFDALPDSLETLVEKGFMTERYLRDENNLPLKAWREGDAMVVESPGKDHWKHSWQGLDARR